MMKLRKSESSPLQLYLNLEASKTDPDPRLGGFDEGDLMELIYDLKYKGLPEDEALLKAAQQELERRT